MTRRLVAISASLMVSCCPSRPVHGELHALSQGGIAATIDHAQANPFSNLRLKGGGFDSALQWGESVKCRVKTTVSEQYADLKAGLKRKRLELCPWEEFAIECEEAFTYHQLWVNPCQGWNSMQRVIDSAAKRAEGAAFVPTHFWPATLVALAQTKLKEYGRSTATAAPPFGSNQGSSWFGKAWGGEDAHSAPTHDVQWVNDKLVAAALQQQQDDASWEAVSSEGGVTVWRKYFPREMRIAGKPIGVSSKFACVKAKAVIDAPLDKVYALFLDNSRVQEYNEYCKDVQDLEWLDPATKVTHSFTGRPWSRDFVTRVHYRALGKDARIVVSRAEEHPKAEATGGYTRMEMALGANIMRRAPGDASKTEFTLITHVNPGGFASTQFGAAVTNRLSTESPRQFIAKLTAAASADRRAGGRRAEGQLGLAGRVRKHARESLIGGAALGAMTLLSR
eukprot:CAMPEP_0196731390 /NCGR_PEP_ID=MMETSP1091-20130531/11149_1 /TAXON_ID=302021 /ORGANISM="Rhodomonas sp., Strain CCMP768" /LENGTH=450 /DNA_ID=CAMNT_0042074523 /DNA_START=251 /DNA_END=1599 /DNA_ORIENTATION=-